MHVWLAVDSYGTNSQWSALPRAGMSSVGFLLCGTTSAMLPGMWKIATSGAALYVPGTAGRGSEQPRLFGERGNPCSIHFVGLAFVAQRRILHELRAHFQRVKVAS